MKPEHEARKAAFLFLYRYCSKQNAIQENSDDLWKDFLKSESPDLQLKDLAWDLASGTLEKREELETALQQKTRNWSWARIASIDKAILLLASFELKFHDKTPRKVVINEAIEFAKAYGHEKSPSFINGILDQL